PATGASTRPVPAALPTAWVDEPAAYVDPHGVAHPRRHGGARRHEDPQLDVLVPADDGPTATAVQRGDELRADSVGPATDPRTGPERESTRLNARHASTSY